MTEEQKDDAQGVTATIKFGAGFEAPWYVGRGSVDQAKADIIETFALDTDMELTLADAIVQATQKAQAMFTAANTLGGFPTGGAKRGASKGRSTTKAATAPSSEADVQSAQPTEGDPWKAAETQQGTPPWEGDGLGEGEQEDPVIAAINAATSRAELGLIWKGNQDAFQREDVQAAMKAAQVKYPKAA